MNPERLQQVREELIQVLEIPGKTYRGICSNAEVAWLIDVMDKQAAEIARMEIDLGLCRQTVKHYEWLAAGKSP